MNCKKILWYSDYGKDCMTGYATVTRNLIDQLKKAYGKDLHITVCAVNYYDKTYTEYDNTVEVVSAKFGPDGKLRTGKFFDEDDFGRTHFLWLYRNMKFDAVFILADYSTVSTIVPLMKAYDAEMNFKKPFNIFYFPVDGPIISNQENEKFESGNLVFQKESYKKFLSKNINHINAISYFDKAVTFTQYGYDEVIKRAGIIDKGHLINSGKLKVIYHGTNINDFYPVFEPQRQKLREKHFGKLSGRTIIGLINRNQPRKDIRT